MDGQAVFVALAFAASLALHSHVSTRPMYESGVVAAVFAVLYTGLFGLLLLSRTEAPLSRPDRVAVMAVAVTLCAAGPLMYILGLRDGALGDLTSFLLVLSVPMIPLSLAAFLVLSASHESEVTLPSDKWI